MRSLICLLLGCLIAVPALAGLEDGLMAAYPLNGDGQDAIGGAHNGEIVGTIVPAADRFGCPGGACWFSGEGAYLRISSFSMPEGSAFTYSAWVRPEAGSPYNDYRMFTHKIGVRQFATGLIQVPNPGGRLNRVLTYFHTSTHFDLDAWFSFSYDRWYLCTTTYDGQYLKTYVNGALVNSLPTLQQTAITAPLYIGGTPEDVYFRGTMDDCRIYGRALSAAEVQQLMDGTDPEARPPDICRVNFSLPDGSEGNATEFPRDGTLRVTVRDLDVTGEEGRAWVDLVGRAAGAKGGRRGIHRRTFPLDADGGVFSGDLPLGEFAPGEVVVIVSARSGKLVGFSRSSKIRIVE